MVCDDSEIMDAYTVIFDGLFHLGPGDHETTRAIAEKIRPLLPSAPRVADFGCGVGASTLVLAQALPDAHVLALDIHAPFIARLRNAAATQGLDDRIQAIVGDMAEPPCLEGNGCAFDLIWSESAIYSIGRSNALKRWLPWLRPHGWLVFSDIVWQREAAARSAEAVAFWTNEYAQIATTESIAVELSAAGYHPLDPVICCNNAWSNYYEPLRVRLHELAQRPHHPPAWDQVMAELQQEIGIYDRAGDEVALAFFCAQRIENNQSLTG